MAQTKAKCLTFDDYLVYDDGSDRRYDLLQNGDLVAVPNESALNDYLARWLMMKLSAVVDLRLIVAHSLTLEVEPVGDSYRNRRPDLVVLRPEHLQLKSILKQTALPLGSPAPQLIAEIVSPGDTASDNYRRDYEWKRQQYQTWNVPEYWIIDPVRSKLTVLVLVDGWYQKTVYTGQQLVVSTVFSELLH
ncbi:Uma2 family endonuclease [Nodosilinea sp. PGN35]|uniref:Uma2 family endonuclease n=1 Tax=Nodosilinea sp. PGN35 TaxID=3020489 RepID=UPI0023B2A012|nr:Uma2 family endonuclease [Nodosilinea sp. TSF1-S3]MDF0366531.1 Uma2 family endonuclease [Nodosilinea sp. TSF1-S3]